MEQQGPSQTEEYVPGKRFYVIFGIVMVMLVSLGFLVRPGYEWNEREGFAFWFWIVGLLIGVLAGPYLVQYAILRHFGVRPRRRKWPNNWGNRSQLISWWETEGYRLTRGQFAVAYGIPALLVCAFALIYVIRFATVAPFFGFVVPTYMGNFWYALLALKRPEETMVEPFDRGVRFYETATQGMLDSRS